MLDLVLALALTPPLQEPVEVAWRTDLAAATIEAREKERPLVLVFR